MVTSRLAGVCVSCSPFAHWLEERVNALPWSGASTRSDGGSAHALSQKHVGNGDRWSEVRSVVVVDVVVVVVVAKDVINLTIQ